jgi:hypothetical protein
MPLPLCVETDRAEELVGLVIQAVAVVDDLWSARLLLGFQCSILFLELHHGARQFSHLQIRVRKLLSQLRDQHFQFDICQRLRRLKEFFRDVSYALFTAPITAPMLNPSGIEVLL